MTRLDTGAPVAGANVSIVRLDNQTFWRGTTGADGVAIAPETPLRDRDDWWRFAFIVTAEKDGDVAYVGSDWNEGITPWEFGTAVQPERSRRRCCAAPSSPIAASTGSARRCTSRRSSGTNTPTGIRLLPAGDGRCSITVRDSAGPRWSTSAPSKVNAWSSAEWTVTLPADGSARQLLGPGDPRGRPAEAEDAGAALRHGR